MFSATEALGLVMAVLDGHHDASDPTDPVGSALGKIVRALPEPVAAQAEAVRRTTAPAPDRAAARPDPGTTTALVQACSEPPAGAARLPLRGRVGVARRGRPVGGRRTPRPVVPAVPVPRQRTPGRAYRIDRVRAVEMLDDTFTPPADLDPVAMLEEHLAVGWEYDVEVVIDAPVDAVARCLPRTLGRLEPLDAETIRLVGSTSNPGWYAEQLAAIPAPYRIVRLPRAPGGRARPRAAAAGGGRVARLPRDRQLAGPVRGVPLDPSGFDARMGEPTDSPVCRPAPPTVWNTMTGAAVMPVAGTCSGAGQSARPDHSWRRMPAANRVRTPSASSSTATSERTVRTLTPSESAIASSPRPADIRATTWR